MPTTRAGNLLCAGLLLVVSLATASGQRSRSKNSSAKIPANILLQIIRAEDERRWDDGLKSLLAHEDPQVRKRAALAAGRIADERAVPVVAEMLLTDRDGDVRQMAAFALGEIESAGGAFALVTVLKDPDRPGRARAVEALGKITAALASTSAPTGQSGAAKDDRLDIFKAMILDVLRFEDARRSKSDRLTILLGLTAVLRTRPEGPVAPAIVRRFLRYGDGRIVADALNTLARLRWKQGNDEARKLLVQHSDPIVRANAARVLGATEDKEALEALLDRALNDSDLRVRVSAIRALAALKDEKAVIPLSRRGSQLTKDAHLTLGSGRSRNELLEILSALGLIRAGKPREDTGPRAAAIMELSLHVRAMSHENILEDEIARARREPEQYTDYLKGFEAAAELPSSDLGKTFYQWRSISARAAGLSELGRVKPPPLATVLEEARSQLRRMMNDSRTPTLAVPNILNAYAVFKPKDLAEVLTDHLTHPDVIVRATAAELLGELPPDEANGRAFIRALFPALRDKELNDAALAILDALGKQKTKEANDAIKTALNSSDHLIRRKAVALLKANGVGDFSNRIGTVQTRNTAADYRRAIARIGRLVTATVVTGKGSFTIEFLPEDAPLTVDNFIQLARRGFFNGQTIPRVVPNFVVQAGDPRGDQNGGPGYQIRCEINEVPYQRATVGMALSGKDTGGSQWFVTHSPQPHLDGGYTVFGRVVAGMDVVDRIARGDIIRRVIVNER
jgi:cyclophilin family peptidyl-prolyl cis-trans isomerase/HEAT repeat protein